MNIDMSKTPISVCLIAKNEEKHIEECLKRLKPYGFEIIVTDTGSTDRTKEIAQKYADKVLDFEWINDFSAARNYCAKHATNNWILVLDCDEYVNSVDLNTLRILMQKFPKFTGILRLKSLVIKDNGEEGYGTDDITRLYNRNYYTFDSPIHEQVCSIDVSKRNETMNCFLLPMEVIHHGYALTGEEMEKKQKRNLDILYSRLETDKDDPYLYFQIGQSEFILGNNDTAIEYYEKGMSFSPDCELVYVQVMIISLAKAYTKTGRINDAIELLEHYSDKCKTAKYTFTMASIMLENNQPLKALLYYVKTTLMHDVDTLGENLLNCYEQIINLYTSMGDTRMAGIFNDKYQECLREKERIMSAN